MSILYRFRVIARFSSKVTNFNPPHLPLSLLPFEFRNELWCQKTRVKGLSCGVICVILRLAVLIQYRSVTDTHTHTETDRQTDTQRRHIPRLARRRAVKRYQKRFVALPVIGIARRWYRWTPIDRRSTRNRRRVYYPRHRTNYVTKLTSFT